MTIFKLPGDLKNASAPDNKFDALPVGEYPVEVVSTDLKPTQTPGRNQIVLQLRVLDGDFKNRQVWERINLPIESEGPESFIYQRLKELSDAVPGAFDLERGTGDTESLKGAQFMIKTRNEKDNRPGYEDNVRTRVGRMYLPQEEEAAATENTEAEPVEEAPAAPAPKAKAVAAPAVKAPVAAAPAPATPAPAAPVKRSVFRRPAQN